MKNTIKKASDKKSTKRFAFVTKNILLLSLISLCTDIASEMLYPVLPLYLSQIGYSVVAIGLIEGLADAVSGLSKGFFGYLSDRYQNKAFFVRLGYGLSTFSKPLMGLTGTVPFIFMARLVDRFGKGIRTAPRDAILALESKPENRGAVFGFHRSMDTLGATIGPIISLLFLFYFPSQYRWLFFLVFIPGLIAFILTLLLKTKPTNGELTSKQTSLEVSEKQVAALARKKSFWKDYRLFWKSAPAPYKKLLVGLLLLSFVNSSDMFLLLRAHELGLSGTAVILAFIIYNFVFALSALPLGMISDKWGFKNVFLLGLAAFVVVYTGFAITEWPMILFGLFAVYGIFAAVNEAVSRAWLSHQLPSEVQATGLGLFMSLHSLAFLCASLVTGLIWENFGGEIAFALTALGGIAVFVYIFFLHLPMTNQETLGRIGCNSSH